ncbi:MAG: DUF1653 domain-containing protein [Candidatus Gracilibacteria bacterium]|nr:DUF1653 domain-containing protein [Candidatus Gracilibacteria bacterium]
MKTGIYKHYKNKLYEVICTGIHTETDERMVIYKALYNTPELSKEYGNDFCFVRPESMFFEDVEVDGKIVPRFEYVGNKKYDEI